MLNPTINSLISTDKNSIFSNYYGIIILGGFTAMIIISLLLWKKIINKNNLKGKDLETSEKPAAKISKRRNLNKNKGISH